MVIPGIYLGEVLGSIASTTALIWTLNSSRIIFGSENDGKCPKAVGLATQALAALVFAKTVVVSIVSLKLVTRAEERMFSEHRVMLRRCILLTRTTVIQCLFDMLILSDLITLVILYTCLHLHFESVICIFKAS